MDHDALCGFAISAPQVHIKTDVIMNSGSYLCCKNLPTRTVRFGR